MEIPAPPGRGRLPATAACLWASVLLGCAHAEKPVPPDATASVASEPAAPSPATVSSSLCALAAGVTPPAFRWPARGAVTSAYGRRGKRLHEGIDISPGRNDLGVRAAAAGTVRYSATKPGYGRVVILSHPDGYETVYAHNQDNLVSKGARVKRGQVIADMGSTGKVSGPHLHFEVRIQGRPVDPQRCLPPRTRPSR